MSNGMKQRLELTWIGKDERPRLEPRILLPVSEQSYKKGKLGDSAQSLRGASFTAVKELIAHIDAFIAAYNQNCVPFDWRKINPEVKSFSSKYSNLCK